MVKDQIDTLPTAEVLAQQHGVSPATVKRAGQYAAAVDAIAKALPDIAPASGRGGAAGNKEDLTAIGRIKHAQNGGDKVSKKATGVVINDKAAQAVSMRNEKKRNLGPSGGTGDPCSAMVRKDDSVLEHQSRGRILMVDCDHR